MLLYRFEGMTSHYGESVLWLKHFPVERETPKCWVISVEGRTKFILKEAKKRWAYPTKELALNSFLIRKRKYLQRFTTLVTLVEQAIKIGSELHFEDPDQTIWPKPDDDDLGL